MKKLTGVSLFIFFCVVTAILTAGLVFYQDRNQPGQMPMVSVIATSTATTTSTKTPTTVVKTPTIPTTPTTPVVTVPTVPTTPSFDAVTVATHNTGADCWMIISGKVYDLSNYDKQHPGGSYAIDAWCGKEATQAFDSNHSSRTKTLLAQYYLGEAK